MPFKRVFVIVLENEGITNTLDDHFFGIELPKKGRLLTNYFAVTHPSQPNYISMISGSTYGVISDFDQCLDGMTIVDSLEKHSKTWTSYQEDYPENGECNLASHYGRYARKHNPFFSFKNIINNSSRCSNVVSSNLLKKHLEKGVLSDYVFYTPNLDNDGHDTSVNFAGKWLKDFLLPLLDHPNMAETLFIVTFDEDENRIMTKNHHRNSYSSKNHHYPKNHSNRNWQKRGIYGSNQVYTLLLGAGITPGSTDSTRYNHYSQLATLEKYWEVESLFLKDKDATPFYFEH